MFRIVVVGSLIAAVHLATPRTLEGFSPMERCSGTTTPSCMHMRQCHQYELCGPGEYCCTVESVTYYYRDSPL